MNPQCIGCTLCLPPCPVDAIVGASGVHAQRVLSNDCTGCELCIPACPVDCITLETCVEQKPSPTRRHDDRMDHPGCINCGACTAVCPIELDAHALYVAPNTPLAQAQLPDCIECGLCDRACPSEIPLAATFSRAKAALLANKTEQQTREQLKRRYEAHIVRQARTAQAAANKRAQRLQKRLTTLASGANSQW